MKVTQGVFKYTNVYGVTFEDKYSGIKTILSTDSYNSQFNANINEYTSQTSTILVDDDSYYNVVDNCNLINCDVKNGRFTNSVLTGSGQTNYINDGYFYKCKLYNYTINGGRFIDCVIDDSNKWNNGYWQNDSGNIDFSTIWVNGVWNSGIFNNPYGWSGGTFNGGTFVSPAIWYDGVANGGVFSAITWHNGLVRNADFVSNCTFNNGTFNSGNFSNSTFNDGIFNNGVLTESQINGGIINYGYISECTIDGNIEINGGNFVNDVILDCNVHNIEATNLIVSGGTFYNGNYYNSIFKSGDIYNGVYNNINGTTSGLTIHNGTFRNSAFNSTNIQNGNFTNCESNDVIWEYGVYSDGKMFNSTWYDGYWNDGLFESVECAIIQSASMFISLIPLPPTTTTTTTTTIAPITTTTTTTSSIIGAINCSDISISREHSPTEYWFVHITVPVAPSVGVTINVKWMGYVIAGGTTSFNVDVLVNPGDLYGYAFFNTTNAIGDLVPYSSYMSSITPELYTNNCSAPQTTTTTTTSPATTTTTTTSGPLTVSLNRTSSSVYTLNIIGGVPPYDYSIDYTTSPIYCGVMSFDPDSGVVNSGHVSILYTYDDGYVLDYTVAAVVTDSNLTVKSATNKFSTCLVPETLITMSDNTTKQLSEININDKVLTLNNNYDIVETIITHKSSHIVDKIININDGLLKSSESHIHLIRIDNNLIQTIAQDLKIGDKLVNINGDDIIINSIEIENKEQEVINISTDLKTYIANGIITHNKNECKPY